jgi:hypothetical protein
MTDGDSNTEIMRGFWSEAEGLRRETFGDPENPGVKPVRL